MQSNKSKMSCKRGFTLIELLVVVLIIGILAAVAVPQYKIAIQKARFAKLRTMASSIVKAVRVYYLAHGDWPTAFSELDIESSLTPTTNNCVQNEEMYCCLHYPVVDVTFGAITCGNSNYTSAFTYRYANADGKGLPAFSKSIATFVCWENLNENLCKTLPGAQGAGSTSSLITPVGLKTGKSYRID